MSGAQVYIGHDVALELVGVTLSGLPDLPALGVPLSASFTLRPSLPGDNDPLRPAASRFVAARPFTGPGALMRRFGIGLWRARWLLISLEDQGVVRGHWNRLVAGCPAGMRDVYAYRMYRVRPHAWAALQGGA
jgi:hypothetical protein